MLFVEKGGNDGVEAYGFSCACGTSHEEVRHFGEVGDERFVADGFAEGDGKFHFPAVAEGIALEHAFHGDDLWLGIGDFDANSAFAGDGGNDADAEGGETQGDVVFKAFDFRDSYAWGGFDFVEGDGGSWGGSDFDNFYVVVAKGFDDVVFV